MEALTFRALWSRYKAFSFTDLIPLQQTAILTLAFIFSILECSDQLSSSLNRIYGYLENAIDPQNATTGVRCKKVLVLNLSCAAKLAIATLTSSYVKAILTNSNHYTKSLLFKTRKLKIGEIGNHVSNVDQSQEAHARHAMPCGVKSFRGGNPERDGTLVLWDEISPLNRIE